MTSDSIRQNLKVDDGMKRKPDKRIKIDKKEMEFWVLVDDFFIYESMATRRPS